MPVLKSTVPVTAGNSETIARNTLWYGFEIASGLVTAFITSIVIARAMGPQKLGYFNYIFWLANISAAIGSFGVPATARKYMAEYFGRGEPGISRAIYQATLRLQTVTAGLITAAGLLLVFQFSDRAYWSSSALLVASVLPGMLTAIPAQANMAAENMRANVPSSLVSSAVYVSFVGLSLTFGWGLPGNRSRPFAQPLFRSHPAPAQRPEVDAKPAARYNAGLASRPHEDVFRAEHRTHASAGDRLGPIRYRASQNV